MIISEFLNRRCVILDLDIDDKKSLMQTLAAKAAGELEISVGPLVKALLDREELGSTGTGDGVAIPHARLHDVKVPFCVCVRLKRAIDFDAIDGQKVDLVALLLLPAGKDARHLTALAAVARQFRKQEVRQALRAVSEPSEVLKALRA